MPTTFFIQSNFNSLSSVSDISTDKNKQLVIMKWWELYSEEVWWLRQCPYFPWLVGNWGTDAEGWIHPGLSVGLGFPLRSVQGSKRCSKGMRAGHCIQSLFCLIFKVETGWLHRLFETCRWWLLLWERNQICNPPGGKKKLRKGCFVLQHFADVNIVS